jgi:hypothetical protein
MGAWRGGFRAVAALAGLALSLSGCMGYCGSQSGEPLRLTWSGTLALGPGTPVSVRVIQFDVGTLPAGGYVKLGVQAEPADHSTWRGLWTEVIDVSDSPIEPTVSHWGLFLNGGDCGNGCSRKYAIVTRREAATATVPVQVTATLEIGVGGGVECGAGNPGPVTAHLNELPELRFDGEPATIIARASGELEVPEYPSTASLDLRLRAAAPLVNLRAFPLIGTVWAGTGDDPASVDGPVLMAVGSNSDWGMNGNRALGGWLSQCASGLDCDLPVHLSAAYVEPYVPASTASALGRSFAPKTPAPRSMHWWVEARLELFSASGQLPAGSLTLTRV